MGMGTVWVLFGDENSHVKWHELDEMAAVSIAGMVAVQDLFHPPEKSVKKMMEDGGTGFSTSTFSTKKGFNLMKNLDSWNMELHF